MTLRARLFLSHAAVAVISLAVLTVAVLLLLSELQRNLRLQALGTAASVMVRNARNATGALDTAPAALLDRLARLNRDRNLRVLVADASGTIVVDSVRAADGSLVGSRVSLSDKPRIVTFGPEIDAASEFRDGQRRRWIYVAMSADNFSTAGVPLPAGLWIIIAQQLRVTPVLSIVEDDFALPIVQGALATMVIAGLIAAFVARSIARPIQHVTAGANSIAAGEFARRVISEGPREVAQLASDFNRMADRVQLAQRMERDFVANVSHELKTPLTSIKGFAQAMIDGATEGPQGTERAAHVIYAEAERLTRLVNSLLDSARMETGDVRMSLATVDVNQVVAACVESLALRAGQLDITLSVQPGDVPSLQADGDRVSQVITNLLDNALKHCSRGGAVRVETKRALGPAGHAGAQVSVADDGYGIPPEDLPRIFERFYQVDKARSPHNSGTGLGLAICKQIVEAHGGTISAQSQLGKSTTISVWLPRDRAASSA